MPRTTTDILDGYGMDIQVGKRQVMDDGMPVFLGTGEPKMEDTWRFVFTATKQDGEQHVVIGPVFVDEGRKLLVEALTGVMPVTTIDLPAGVTI